MHIFSNLKVVGLILLLVLAGFFFLISTKPKPQADVPPPVVVENTNSSNFMEEAEKRREQMLEEKSAVERQEKLLKQKENSVECQFWRQQKTVSSEAKVDEKIIEFCTLSSVSSGADSSVATSTGEAANDASAPLSAETQAQ